MSMIERVARAMCESDGFRWMADSSNETANGETPEEQRDYWRDKARAAIEAMREPTEAMCRSGESSKGASLPDAWVDGSYTPENVELIWKDMIDAALKGEAE